MVLRYTSKVYRFFILTNFDAFFYIKITIISDWRLIVLKRIYYEISRLWYLKMKYTND